MSLEKKICQQQAFHIKKVMIHIHQIQIPVFIGFFDWERKQKQNILVDLDLELDASLRVSSDALHDTVDYSQIIEKMAQKCQEKKFFLIEKVAHEMSECLFENPLVLTAKISVKKQNPLFQCQSVSTTLFIEKNNIKL